MNHHRSMAQQQPYFIPRVAGTPEPRPEPPVLQPPPAGISGGSSRALARYCWLSALVAMIAGLALGTFKPPLSKEASFAAEVILGLLWLSGIVTGIIALFGVRRHGGKGILTPALVGLIFWMATIALAVLSIPTFKKFQEHAVRLKASASEALARSPSDSPLDPASVTQSSPVYPEGSTRVDDKEFGFSFAVPEGYTVASEKASEEVHSFKRKFFTEPTRIISIKKVDGDYSRRMASAKNLPPPSARQTVESAVFDWRGRKVGGTRSVDAGRNPPFLVFSVVIPLHKQNMVLDVGGAAEYEPVILETVDQILGSLVEESSP